MTHRDAHACHTPSVKCDAPLREKIGVTASLVKRSAGAAPLPKRSQKL